MNLGEHLDIPAGTPLTAMPAVDYAVGFNDGVFSSPATIEVSGKLHDAALDHTATVTKTVNVVISRPRVALTVSPEPTSGLAPLTVGYTFLVTNDSPVDPDSGAVRPAVAAAGITDDRCAPVTLTGGDADGDALLDQGETWR